jgi:hypothetical protein
VYTNNKKEAHLMVCFFFLALRARFGICSGVRSLKYTLNIRIRHPSTEECRFFIYDSTALWKKASDLQSDA